MRTAYREQLDTFAHDLIVMSDLVDAVMDKTATALLTAQLQPAEEALSAADDLEDIRLRCEERAVALLALQNPLAKDLRQVVSSIYIVEDLHRMGELAMHIARAARRRHPESVIPAQFLGYFEEYARLSKEMLARTRDVLIDADADVALTLTEDDDAIDDINTHLLSLVTRNNWPGTAREAVEMALLSRFFERFSDHCVNVAARIVFLTTGLIPEEYQAKQARDLDRQAIDARFAQLERQFRR